MALLALKSPVIYIIQNGVEIIQSSLTGFLLDSGDVLEISLKRKYVRIFVQLHVFTGNLAGLLKRYCSITSEAPSAGEQNSVSMTW